MDGEKGNGESCGKLKKQKRNSEKQGSATGDRRDRRAANPKSAAQGGSQKARAVRNAPPFCPGRRSLSAAALAEQRDQRNYDKREHEQRGKDKAHDADDVFRVVHISVPFGFFGHSLFPRQSVKRRGRNGRQGRRGKRQNTSPLAKCRYKSSAMPPSSAKRQKRSGISAASSLMRLLDEGLLTRRGLLRGLFLAGRAETRRARRTGLRFILTRRTRLMRLDPSFFFTLSPPCFCRHVILAQHEGVFKAQKPRIPK